MKNEKKTIKFTSLYTLDKKTYKEFNKNYLLANKGLVIAFCLILIGNLINFFFGDYKFVLKICTYEFVFLSVFFLIFKRSASLNYIRTFESNGRQDYKSKVTITETAIKLENLENKNKNSYEFSQIVDLIDSKNMLILKLKYNLGIIIDKNNLKGGTVEELITFLKDTCENLATKTPNLKVFSIINIISLTLTLILFILSFIFICQNNLFFQHIQDTLTNKDYELNLYSNENADLIIYGLNKKGSENEYYLYKFQDESFAEDSFSNWEDLEKEGGTSNCDKSSNYEICYITSSTNYTVLIRKTNHIFYGTTKKEEKKELDTILTEINYLK